MAPSKTIGYVTCALTGLTVSAALAGDHYQYGSWNDYGGGQARTVIRTSDSTGVNMTGYGFQMTRGTVTDPDTEHGIHMEYGRSGIPFDNVDLHFLSAGHEGGPGDTYWAAPHFDFHFFTITEAERAGITDPDVGYEAPPAAAIPTGYVQAPGSFVPTEGVHWFDPGEFGGGPPFEFTNSTIYGFYDRSMTFFEPMSSQAFMDDLANGTADPVSFDVAQAAAVPTSGYWPGEWSMDYDDGTYTVMLGDLQYNAVPGGGGLAMIGLSALGVARRRRR